MLASSCMPSRCVRVLPTLPLSADVISPECKAVRHDSRLPPLSPCLPADKIFNAAISLSHRDSVLSQDVFSPPGAQMMVAPPWIVLPLLLQPPAIYSTSGLQLGLEALKAKAILRSLWGASANSVSACPQWGGALMNISRCFCHDQLYT